MWDLKTIKEINDVKKMDKVMTKLWHHFNAWKKFLTNNKRHNENK